MRTRLAVVALLGLLPGCAAVSSAPRNIENSWTDPVRRSHSLERITESALGGIAGITAYEGTCRLFTTATPARYVWVGSLATPEQLAPTFSVRYHPARSQRGCQRWYHYTTAILVGSIATTLTEYAVYEFAFEPAGWGGHYWQRGPRDSERFRKAGPGPEVGHPRIPRSSTRD